MPAELPAATPDRSRETRVASLMLLALFLLTLLMGVLYFFSSGSGNLSGKISFASIITNPRTLLIIVVMFLFVWIISLNIWRTHFINYTTLHKWPLYAILATSIVFATGILLAQKQAQLTLYALVTQGGSTTVSNWKAMVLQSSARSLADANIIVMGSSQIGSAVDTRMLQKLLHGETVERYIAPGFGILQYQMSKDGLMGLHPKIVVCWLSEFDTFRGDIIPANRLKYTVTLSGLVQLVSLLGIRETWNNRSELADLTASSFLQLWRDRDLLRPLILAEKGELRPANQLSRDNHIRKLKETIHRSKLLDINFASFALFAGEMKQQGVELYLLEGITNPMAMTSYDPDGRFRLESRHRFQEMANEIGFHYMTREQMPRVTVSDFSDATHLNHFYRDRFTRFLAGYLLKVDEAGLVNAEENGE